MDIKKGLIRLAEDWEDRARKLREAAATLPDIPKGNYPYDEYSCDRCGKELVQVDEHGSMACPTSVSSECKPTWRRCVIEVHEGNEVRKRDCTCGLPCPKPGSYIQELHDLTGKTITHRNLGLRTD